MVSNSIKSVLSVVWYALPKKRRIQYSYILVLMILSSVADVVSLGAVIPFLGVILNPEKILEFKFLSYICEGLGYTNGNELVLPFTVFFCSSVIMAALIRVLLLYGNAKISSLSGADLGIEVYKRTLYQPYEVHVARNSSDVISGITKVEVAVIVINQGIILISSMLSIILIILTLLVVDADVAIIAIVSGGLTYGILTFVMRKKLLKNSNRISIERTKLFKAKQEGLGGIREILLDGTQAFYCNIFAKADSLLRNAVSNNMFLNGSPRHIMESFGIILIAGLAYYLSGLEGSISVFIPSLGALALGAQRLLPALQQGYASWATIMGCHVSLVHLVDLLQQPISSHLISDIKIQPYEFKNSITFDHVEFSYMSNGKTLVLEDINLIIKKGEHIGIVGATGSGKSTFINIMMGLLKPTKGFMSIDSNILRDEDILSWQRNIVHVPQNIYLSDSSFAENIAFGIPYDQIDMERVKRVAKQAQISDYIDSRENSYHTVVGERGVRLSGGQRQRIGVARALYKDGNVLVLDEATSALDNATERSLMNSIQNLDKNLTIVIIAHRFATIQHCSKIVVLENGQIVSTGSIKELENRCETFKELASQQHFEV